MLKTRTGSQKARLLKASRLSIVATTLVALGTGVAGCVTDQPVNKPCGVITDGLGDVQATTREGNKRIDAHFERGVRAGCWERSSATSAR